MIKPFLDGDFFLKPLNLAILELHDLPQPVQMRWSWWPLCETLSYCV